MNNSETPTGVNGKNELKVTRTEDVDNLLDKFFEDLTNEGYGKVHLNCITFDVPPHEIQKALKDAEVPTFTEVINNAEPGRKTFDPVEIDNGVKVKEGKAPIKKVKNKVKKLKEEKAAEKETSAGKTGKPSSGGSDRSSR